MSLILDLKPEVAFALRLSQENAGTLLLATPGAGLQLNLTPVVIGAAGREGLPGGVSEERMAEAVREQIYDYDALVASTLTL